MNVPNLQPPQAPIKQKRARHPKARANCVTCKTEFLYHISAKKGRFCSYACYWKDMKANSSLAKGVHRYHGPAWNKGKKGCYTPEHCKRMSAARMGKKRPYCSGPNHPCWQGGISPMRLQIWRSPEYQQWRKAVFERDDHTCRCCEQRGGKLQADHLRLFALFPELRFEVANGQTLCVPCHREKSNADNSLAALRSRPVVAVMREVWMDLIRVCYNRPVTPQ